MRGSLLQDNDIDKMRSGLSKSWGKVPTACVGHTTRDSNCIAKCEVSTRSPVFLCMRQRRPTTEVQVLSILASDII